MGIVDKLRNKLEMAEGRARQAAGQAGGNKDTEADGQSDRTEGGMRQAGERLKDSAKNVKDAFKK